MCSRFQKRNSRIGILGQQFFRAITGHACQVPPPALQRSGGNAWRIPSSGDVIASLIRCGPAN